MGILPPAEVGIFLASPARPSLILRGPVGTDGFQVPGEATTGAALGAAGAAGGL